MAHGKQSFGKHDGRHGKCRRKMSQDSRLSLQMGLSVTLDVERKAGLSSPGEVEWFTLSSLKTFFL